MVPLGVCAKDLISVGVLAIYALDDLAEIAPRIGPSHGAAMRGWRPIAFVINLRSVVISTQEQDALLRDRAEGKRRNGELSNIQNLHPLWMAGLP